MRCRRGCMVPLDCPSSTWLAHTAQLFDSLVSMFSCSLSLSSPLLVRRPLPKLEEIAMPTGTRTVCSRARSVLYSRYSKRRLRTMTR